MAFLVRKLMKRAALYETYSEKKDVRNIVADIPTSEFRTTNGALSTWYINNLKDFDKAILAIAVTSSRIDKMDFIIINTSFLDEEGLKYKKTFAGKKLAIPELQDLHYDIIGVTLNRLSSCAELYQKITNYDNSVDESDSNANHYIIRVPAREIKQKLAQAISDGKVDPTLAVGEIKETILQLEKIVS